MTGIPAPSALSVGLVERRVVDQADPDPVRLAGDRGIHRRDHLADDRGRRAGPLVRATSDGTSVLEPVDRRREERVRRHVVDHHELVLRVAREERGVAVFARQPGRVGALGAEQPGKPGISRTGRGRPTGVPEEAPPRELPLLLADVVVPVCHLSSFSNSLSVPIEPACCPRRDGLGRHFPDHQFDDRI